LKVIITGGTGYIGRSITCALRETHQIVIVTRDPAAPNLPQLKNVRYISYKDLQDTLPELDADVMVHMATLNNNSTSTVKDYRLVNVELTALMASLCEEYSVPLVHFSSSHAAPSYSIDDYSISKLEALENLSKFKRLNYLVITLPAVVTSERPAGILRYLWVLSGQLRSWALPYISVLKPVTTEDKVVQAVQFAIYRLTTPSLDVEPERRQIYIGTEAAKSRLYRFWQAVITGLFISLAFPIFLTITPLIWPIVRYSTGGSFLFTQTRVGRYGKPFKVYKVRTMVVGTPEQPTHCMTENSVPGLVRYLRSSRLDELPQIWNILLGQMTLIGPRPCLLSQADLIEERGKHGILDYMPGITGWAQVSGVDMSDTARLLTYDLYYRHYHSIILDIKILYRTIRKNSFVDHIGK